MMNNLVRMYVGNCSEPHEVGFRNNAWAERRSRMFIIDGCGLFRVGKQWESDSDDAPYPLLHKGSSTSKGCIALAQIARR